LDIAGPAPSATGQTHQIEVLAMSLQNVHRIAIYSFAATLLLASCAWAQTSGGSQAGGKKPAAPAAQEEPAPADPQLDGAKISPAPAASLPEDDVAHGESEEPATADARITGIEERLTSLEKQLQDQESLLQGLRDDLAALRDSTTQRVARPTLGPDSANVESAPVQLGKLLVENRTALGYTMAINGALFFVPPGHRGELQIPVGAVVTELRGFEAPKTWQAGDWKKVGDDFQLAIQIQ
jgi:hypothetical protein